MLKIFKINENFPLELLYLADPSETAVADYISRGECYCAFHQELLIGVYILLPTRPFTAEIVNVAVAEEWQGRGFGRQLVDHAVEKARAKGYRKLEIGTANSGAMQISLYQKCGFRMEWIDRDFFRKHYDGPVIDENGLECRDMVRLGMDL